MTDRRAFLAGVAALGAMGARAQPAAIPRIGWISYTDPGVALSAFRDGLRALGYSGPREIGVEVRVVEAKPDRVRVAIETLQAVPVSLIIAQAAAGPVAHRLVAGRTPLVFAFSGDPVVARMVESFGRPGGNTTGMSFMALELVGKRLEVMKEIEPRVRRVAILANPQHPGETAELRASLDAAKRMRVQTPYVPISPSRNGCSRFPDGRISHIRALSRPMART